MGYLIFAALDVDDPTVHDASMIVTQVKVPETQNGYAYLIQARSLAEFPDRQNDLENRIVSSLTKPDSQTDQELNELLKNNKDNFEAQERADKCQRFQRSTTHESIDQFGKYEWVLQLERLRSLRAYAWFKQGKEKEAFKEAVNIMTAGRRFQNAGGSLTTACVGMVIQAIGWKTVRNLLPYSHLDASTLVDFAQSNDNFAVDVNGIGNALRLEYVIDAEIIDLKHARKLPLFYRPLPELPWMQILLKPNRTKNLLVYRFQNLIEDFQSSYLSQKALKSNEWTRSIWPVIFSTNPIGEAYLITLTYGWNFVLQTKCIINNEGAATQLLLALRAYEEETGALPDSLSLLAPKYLEKIPTDNFTGSSWHYSKKLRAIWAGDINLPLDIRKKMSENENVEERVFKISELPR